MARSRLYLTVASPKQWDVWIRETDQHVAVLYAQSNGGGFRFRLDNYRQSMSKLCKDKKTALAEIEREVL
jgi:hypothetical protein